MGLQCMYRVFYSCVYYLFFCIRLYFHKIENICTLIKHTFSPLWIPNRAQFFYLAIQRRRRLVLYSRLSFSDSATAELLYDNFTLSSQMHIWYRLMNIMFMKQDLFANWIVYHIHSICIQLYYYKHRWRYDSKSVLFRKYKECMYTYEHMLQANT